MHLHSTEHTRILRKDERDEITQAHHHYDIMAIDRDENTVDSFSIAFQKGPLEEVGPNGIMDEDLLVLLIDRFKGLQTSKYHCHEYTMALVHLKKAHHYLRYRAEELKIKHSENSSTGTHHACP